MSPSARARLLREQQAWMTMQRQRVARLAEHHVASYNARVRAQQDTSTVMVETRGYTYGGPGSNYGRTSGEQGWEHVVRANVERR